MTIDEYRDDPADDFAPNPRASQAAAARARRALGTPPEAPVTKPQIDPRIVAVVGILAVAGVVALAFSQFSTSGPLVIPPTDAPAHTFSRAQEGQRETISATSAPTAAPTLAATPTAIPLAAPVSAPMVVPQLADWTQPEIAPAETGEKPAPDRTKARATAIARGQLPPPAR